MGRGMRFRETPATPDEDSYTYRVEWDARIHIVGGKVKNDGPGSRSFNGFDNAWDVYCDRLDDPDYIRVRLIQIDKDGNETRRN